MRKKMFGYLTEVFSSCIMVSEVSKENVMMRRSRVVVSDQLRQAIRDSGLSLLGIAEASGVDDSALSRFMRGKRDLTTRSVDKLCRYLNLELRKSKQKGR